MKSTLKKSDILPVLSLQNKVRLNIDYVEILLKMGRKKIFLSKLPFTDWHLIKSTRAAFAGSGWDVNYYSHTTKSGRKSSYFKFL